MAVQRDGLHALTIAAEGRKADSAKPLVGFGSGVLEIVLRHRTDAFRVVYATQLGKDLWVLHAFQKKSKSGRRTPLHELDVIRTRIRRLKEML
jgi:phage-related protein